MRNIFVGLTVHAALSQSYYSFADRYLLNSKMEFTSEAALISHNLVLKSNWPQISQRNKNNDLALNSHNEAKENNLEIKYIYRILH